MSTQSSYSGEQNHTGKRDIAHQEQGLGIVSVALGFHITEVVCDLGLIPTFPIGKVATQGWKAGF